MPSSIVAHGLPKIRGREIEPPAHSIGTMRRGVGPACSPRVSRKTITICEGFNGELFERKQLNRRLMSTRVKQVP
ncbi:hypothetical protein VD0004_g9763 [Verticillium dahliae]|nr:hypothetical protein VD0004_g9763 [Verticillium dahliae]